MKRLVLILFTLGVVMVLGAVGIVALAARSFGPPAPTLGPLQALQYAARVLWADGILTKPVSPGAPEQKFDIQAGESVESLCSRLEWENLVLDGGALRDYLVYTGRDTTIQAGRYVLNGDMSIVDVADRIQDSTPTDVDFAVLPGWRIEEIAATLPTSGLDIAPEEFTAAARGPHGEFEFLAGASTAEGFLYPDSYVVGRTTTASGLLEDLLRNFRLHLSAEMEQGFRNQGLNVYQAVILASIVERETVRDEEAPVIASVYLNRWRASMHLDADPTVQYALGFNAVQQTWWTNPLSLEDLKVNSPYNTYLVGDLPPAPISNPGSAALNAVAFPAVSPYFFFSSRCDGSGFHTFAETFEQHLGNLCP
ncbi:MAG TPA: endolytic transglycosylase MltG [Anaerolineales bacterium]